MQAPDNAFFEKGFPPLCMAFGHAIVRRIVQAMPILLLAICEYDRVAMLSTGERHASR